MQQANLISRDVDNRVEKAIFDSFELYISKIAAGFYSISVEAPMQLHVMKLIDEKLQELTLDKNERFIVDLEKNIPLNGRNDEVDGVIEYYKNGAYQFSYLIEFKYKKPKDGGPNGSNIESYVDIYELEQQCDLNKRFVRRCFFIFLTSDEDYTVRGNRADANRMVFPLHDGYTIEPRIYRPIVPAAVKQLSGKGYAELSFRNEYGIEYLRFNAEETSYYYFILEIGL